MLGAKNTMLCFIAKSGTWPATHAESLATFYVNLELHPRVLLPNGKQTLLLYQACVRREWYDAFKWAAGFNIELLQDNLLRFTAEEINGMNIAREIEQVQCSPVVSPMPYQSADVNLPLPLPLYPLPSSLIACLFLPCQRAVCHPPPPAICHFMHLRRIANCHCHLPICCLPLRPSPRPPIPCRPLY